MKKEYCISIPVNITQTNLGVKFYDKVQVVECRAKNLSDIYFKYPNALNVRVKDK